MAVSVIPALIDALVTAATDALPGVQVYDGFGVSDDPGDFLMVGVDDPDSTDKASSGSSEQDWHGTGVEADRDEIGDITCVALSWNGDGPQGQKAARDGAFTIAEAVSTLCRANPSLGVPAVLWTSYGTSTDLQQSQDGTGAMALLVFRVHFEALI
jgi:hypothetical protein